MYTVAMHCSHTLLCYTRTLYSYTILIQHTHTPYSYNPLIYASSHIARLATDPALLLHEVATEG
jgi:hypothetical protein